MQHLSPNPAHKRRVSDDVTQRRAKPLQQPKFDKNSNQTALLKEWDQQIHFLTPPSAQHHDVGVNAPIAAPEPLASNAIQSAEACARTVAPNRHRVVSGARVCRSCWCQSGTPQPPHLFPSSAVAPGAHLQRTSCPKASLRRQLQQSARPSRRCVDQGLDHGLWRSYGPSAPVA